MIRLADIDILARTIYGEARGEPFDGKVAVGRTVINRWQAKKWFSGDTIQNTAQMAWQYSCWNKNDPNRGKILDVTYADSALRECMTAAMEALEGGGAPWLKGCTHYYADSLKDPPNWAVGKTPAGRLGSHQFFAGID